MKIIYSPNGKLYFSREYANEKFRGYNITYKGFLSIILNVI